jgi:hypothetical protein
VHNTVLAEIARLHPTTLENLESIKGIGARKIEQFGQEIIEVVRDRPQSSPSRTAGPIESGPGDAPPAAPNPIAQPATESVQSEVRFQIELYRQGGPEPDRGALLAVLDRAEVVKSKDLIVAINALAALGERQAIAPLMRLLESASGDVLMSAAEALGQLGGLEAIPQFTELLSDQRPGVRRAAVRALGRLRAADALEVLKQMAAEDESDYVRLAAQAAATLIEAER